MKAKLKLMIWVFVMLMTSVGVGYMESNRMVCPRCDTLMFPEKMYGIRTCSGCGATEDTVRAFASDSSYWRSE